MFAFAFAAVIPGFVLEEPARQEAPVPSSTPPPGRLPRVGLANNSGPPRRPECGPRVTASRWASP